MKTFPMGYWLSNWLTYLKSTHKIAIGSLDGRGSKAAGDKLKFEMYRKLSTVEVEDQIIAGRWVFTTIKELFYNSVVHLKLNCFVSFLVGWCQKIRVVSFWAKHTINWTVSSWKRLKSCTSLWLHWVWLMGPD